MGGFSSVYLFGGELAMDSQIRIFGYKSDPGPSCEGPAVSYFVVSGGRFVRRIGYALNRSTEYVVTACRCGFSLRNYLFARIPYTGSTEGNQLALEIIQRITPVSPARRLTRADSR